MTIFTVAVGAVTFIAASTAAVGMSEAVSASAFCEEPPLNPEIPYPAYTPVLGQSPFSVAIGDPNADDMPDSGHDVLTTMRSIS